MLGYAAIDARARYWFAEAATLRLHIEDCQDCRLFENDRVLAKARTDTGVEQLELKAAVLGAGEHTLVLARAGQPCSHVSAVVASTATGPLAEALSEEAKVREIQAADDAKKALKAWEEAAGLPSTALFPSLSGKRLRNAAYFAHRLRDLSGMQALLARAEALDARLGDEEGKVALAYYQGLLALELFRFVEAHGTLSRAGERAEALALASVASSAHEALGLLLERLGRFEGALLQLERAREALGTRAREADPKARHAINVSWVHLRMFEARPTAAHAREAERTLREAFALATDDFDRAEVATNLAWLGVRTANVPLASHWLREARARDLRGETYGAPYWDWLTGELRAREHKPNAARTSFARALANARAGRAPEDLTWLTAASLAALAAHEGRIREALAGFRAASGALFVRQEVLTHALGRASFLGGQRATFERALAFFIEQGYPDDALKLVARALSMQKLLARPCAECDVDVPDAHLTALLARLGAAQDSLRRLARDEGLLSPPEEHARAQAQAHLMHEERAAVFELSELLDGARSMRDDVELDVSSLSAALGAGELVVVEHAVEGAAPLRLFVSRRGVEAARAGMLSLERMVERTEATHVYYVSPLDGLAPAHAAPWERALLARASVSRLDRLEALLTARRPDRLRSPALVVADSRADLPHARAEGKSVAEALSATLLVADQVTRPRLLRELSRVRHLHVAGHVEARPLHPGGDALLLADGDSLSALEVALLPRVPEVVVLSSCRERAHDASTEPISAELTEAFLAAGAHLVLSARRPARDAEARRFMELFVEQLAHTTPAEAQRRTGSLLHARGDSAWDLFYLAGVP